MDESPDVLADQVRAKRVAVDNDLELLRLKMTRWDPRQMDRTRLARIAASGVAAAALIYWWRRRRRRLRTSF